MKVHWTYFSFAPRPQQLPTLDANEDCQPSPFSGDFYGQDYTEAELGWDEQCSNDVLDDSMMEWSGDRSDLDFNFLKDAIFLSTRIRY